MTCTNYMYCLYLSSQEDIEKFKLEMMKRQQQPQLVRKSLMASPTATADKGSVGEDGESVSNNNNNNKDSESQTETRVTMDELDVD